MGRLGVASAAAGSLGRRVARRGFGRLCTRTRPSEGGLRVPIVPAPQADPPASDLHPNCPHGGPPRVLGCRTDPMDYGTGAGTKCAGRTTAVHEKGPVAADAVVRGLPRSGTRTPRRDAEFASQNAAGPAEGAIGMRIPRWDAGSGCRNARVPVDPRSRHFLCQAGSGSRPPFPEVVRRVGITHSSKLLPVVAGRALVIGLGIPTGRRDRLRLSSEHRLL